MVRAMNKSYVSLDRLSSYDGKIKDYISQSLNSFIDTIYPVGSVYLSTSSTPPQSLFGGTWEQIKDTFLLSAGDVYTAGTTGGNSTYYLTEDQTPFYKTVEEVSGYGLELAGGFKDRLVVERPSETAKNSVNNMPPYLTVYMWKRTV